MHKVVREREERATKRVMKSENKMDVEMLMMCLKILEEEL